MNIADLLRIVRAVKVIKEQEGQRQNFLIEINTQYKKDKKSFKLIKKAKDWSESIASKIYPNIF